MQSRRHDDYVTVSQSSKMGNQQKIEVGHDTYQLPCAGASDQSPGPSQRSLSPRGKIEGSRRVPLQEGKNGSTERKDHDGGHLGGSRTEKILSRSPPYSHEHTRHRFDERVIRRKYEYDEDINYDNDRIDRSKQVYAYDHQVASARMRQEKHYIENRIVRLDETGMMGQKSLPMGDGLTRGSYQLPPDLIPASNYRKTGEHLTSPMQHINMDRFERDRLHFWETIPPDRRPMMELHNEGEKSIIHSRLPASSSNDFGSTSQFNPGTSAGNPRSEFPCSCMEGVCIPASIEHPRSSVKIIEPIDYNLYGQRSGLDSRGLEPDKKIITSYEQGAYGPMKAEHGNFLYLKSQRIPNDEYGYPPNDVRGMMLSNSRLEYEHARMDNENRELPRTSIIHPVISKNNHMEESYGSMRRSLELDHHTMQKQTAIENTNPSRILYSSKHGGEFLGSGYSQLDFGRRVPRDDEVSHFGVAQGHTISHIGSDYGFGRHSGPKFLGERLQDPPVSMHDLKFQEEMQRRDVKMLNMRMEEYAIYEPSDKVLKRKYPMEEDVNKHDTRTIVSNKWHAPKEFADPYDGGDEFIDEETFALRASWTQRFDHSIYKKVRSAHHRHNQPRDFVTADWESPRDSLLHMQRHSVRHLKENSKYIKGHSKSSTLSWHNSKQIDRSSVHRHHRTWKRNYHYDENACAIYDDPSENLVVDVTESEPSEDTEEFKQLVDDAFLLYSKRLNLNSAVQRRYKEQGKAGSLFCIVCGRSSSKEFMDTQRLVTHAFMSHKVGLRAHHLGLHKAICVLMGWNVLVPSDTITWVPDVLPDAEALAQKEDLMLWPPVIIIHNVSMSNKNPEHQKVIPIEGVETFVRGKGLIGGKITVCLGKPADQSIILVKFLGTFTGLGNAEKLYKYFLEKNRGREEFARKTSASSGSSWEGGTDGENLEEQLLYGYMGIAEDLDRLDFHTKNRITIKSKKEIQDLANDPVKSDDR